MINIGIVGSRSYPHLDLVQNITASLWYNESFKLISGGASGVDRSAEDVLCECCYNDHLEINDHKLIFLPDWNKFKKAAGFIRNTDIVSNSNLIVCFWNSLSETKGCLDTLDKMIKLENPTICLDENKEVAHWFLDKTPKETILTKERLLKIIEQNILSSNS